MWFKPKYKSMPKDPSKPCWMKIVWCVNGEIQKDDSLVVFDNQYQLEEFSKILGTTLSFGAKVLKNMK